MGKKNKIGRFTETLIHCSNLAATTFIRMEELVTQSLYFLPNYDTRLRMMRQYYENVVRFIDEITYILNNTQDTNKTALFMYELFFENLKDIAHNYYSIVALFATKDFAISNISMDELISLNKTVEYSINFFNRLINQGDKKGIDENWHLAELEFAANEHYRIITYNILVSDYTWKGAMFVQMLSQLMISIVNLSIKSIKILPLIREKKIKK